MGTTNYGSQEILFKYETPLDSLYLARYLEGFASLGLSSYPEITQVAGALVPTIQVHPFSCYLQDALTSQYTFKITTTAKATVVLSPDDICLGFQYAYRADAVCYGDFMGLTAEEAQEFNGIILCTVLIDSDNTVHTSFNGADMTQALYCADNFPWQSIHALSPKDELWSPTMIGFCRGSVRLPLIHTIINYQDTGTQSYVDFDTSLDMEEYEPGWYYVGYRTTFDRERDGYDPSLLVLTDPARTRQELLSTIPLMHTVMCIVHWTGDVRTSSFEPIQDTAGPVGGTSGGASIIGGARGTIVYQVRPSVTGFVPVGQEGDLLRMVDGIPEWKSAAYMVKTEGPFTFIPWEDLGIEYDENENYMVFALEKEARLEAMPCNVQMYPEGIIIACISLHDGELEEYISYAAFGGGMYWGESVWGGYVPTFVNVFLFYAHDAENEPIDPYTPTITTDLVPAQTIPSGNGFMLAVEAETVMGNRLTYTWYRGESRLVDGTSSTGAIISGATTSILNVAHTSYLDTGRYSVVVTNADKTTFSGRAFSVSSRQCLVTVAVADVPHFTLNLPSTYNVTESYPATFQVSCTANGSLTYQWQKYDSDSSEWVNIVGATASTYVLSRATSETLDGDYRVYVLNTMGDTTADAYSDVCTATTVDVSNPVLVLDLPASSSVPYQEDAELSVEAVSVDNGSITYQWQAYNNQALAWQDISGAEDSTYVIESAVTGGTYRCIITNTRETSGGTQVSASIDSTACVLSVITAAQPQFDTNLPASITIVRGGSQSLHVVATVSDSGTLSYVWYFKGTTDADFHVLEGVTENMYTITSADLADAGTYRVVVTNTLGHSQVSNTSNDCVVAISSS